MSHGFAYAQTADIAFKITEREAASLASKAYFGSDKDIKWFDYGKNMDMPFYTYDGMALTNGSFGFFAINPWTGDVWALWGCHKISTPASLKMRVAIKKRFTAEELKQYKQLSQLKPECIDDDSEDQPR